VEIEVVEVDLAVKVDGLRETATHPSHGSSLCVKKKEAEAVD
jgi:hypothetical protein